jgi:hypothetical protein
LETGLKANALYRDGCKLSQPLSNKKDEEKDKKETAAAAPVAVAPEQRSRVQQTDTGAGVGGSTCADAGKQRH